MATWRMKSEAGNKFNRKRVSEIVDRRDGREYLLHCHNKEDLNISLSEEVLDHINNTLTVDDYLDEIEGCIKAIRASGCKCDGFDITAYETLMGLKDKLEGKYLTEK